MASTECDNANASLPSWPSPTLYHVRWSLNMVARYFDGNVSIAIRLDTQVASFRLHCGPSLNVLSARALQGKKTFPLTVSRCSDWLARKRSGSNECALFDVDDSIVCELEDNQELNIGKAELQLSFRGPINSRGVLHGIFCSGGADAEPSNGADSSADAGPKKSRAGGGGGGDKRGASRKGGGVAKSSGPSALVVATHFEPEFARTALPCVDVVASRAVFVVELHRVPAECSAVSNMPVAKESVENGLKTFVFAPSLPMAPYLLAFAVGNFAVTPVRSVSLADSNSNSNSASEVSLRVWQSRASAGSYPVEAVLDLTESALTWCSDYFGAPYSLPKLDVVLIPRMCLGGVRKL